METKNYDGILKIIHKKTKKSIIPYNRNIGDIKTILDYFSNIYYDPDNLFRIDINGIWKIPTSINQKIIIGKSFTYNFRTSILGNFIDTAEFFFDYNIRKILNKNKWEIEFNLNTEEDIKEFRLIPRPF
ncbi:hypothetical protein FPHOBKDP_00101 [Listeria phage LPJP1]|nr:hypothetical protein FPHOBKDP_00101 [Listeria phage LPJP1]